MAEIQYRAGPDLLVNVTAGSGLGLYGDDFGDSVPVGEYQDRTFITDSIGVAQGPECNNIKYANSTQGYINQAGTSINLTAIPNYQATLKIRFQNDVPCEVFNAQCWSYDRTSIAAGPTGVICRLAEIIHTGTTQVDTGGGDATWYNSAGTGGRVPLQQSPGPSGSTPGASATVHEWFVAISGSPDTVGSKTKFALWTSLEYL